MKFIVKKTSDYDWYEIKEFNSFEKLIDFLKECGHELIITTNDYYQWSIENIIRAFSSVTVKDAEIIQNIEYCIEIYDYYRE